MIHGDKDSDVKGYSAFAPQTRMERVQTATQNWGGKPWGIAVPQHPCGRCWRTARTDEGWPSLVCHSPVWKASLDNLIQRSRSLSILQIEYCFLCSLMIWDIFETEICRRGGKKRKKQKTLYLALHLHISANMNFNIHGNFSYYCCLLAWVIVSLFSKQFSSVLRFDILFKRKEQDNINV